MFYTPFISSFESQYKAITINSVDIDSSDDRNNCLMLCSGTIVNVMNFVVRENKLYLIGKQCLIQRELYNLSRFHSGTLGINIIVESKKIEEWSVDSIFCKIFKIPCKKGFITFPLIHTSTNLARS